MSKKTFFFTLGVVCLAVIVLIIGYQVLWHPQAGPEIPPTHQIPVSTPVEATVSSNAFTVDLGADSATTGTYTVTATYGDTTTTTEFDIVDVCTADSTIIAKCGCGSDVFSEGYCCLGGGNVPVESACGYGSIEGLVIDNNGNPISGVIVNLNDKNANFISQATTDDSGNFSFTKACDSFGLTFSKDGYDKKGAVPKIIVGATATVLVELTESASTGSLSGTVTNSETGEPIAGALIQYRNIANGEGSTTVTTPVGSYSASLPEGDYMLTASADGFDKSAKVPVTISKKTPVVQDFSLTPIVYGSLSGTVTNGATGKPIAGASILYANPVTGEGGTTATTTVGSYSASLPEGDYMLSASADGFDRSAEVPVTISEKTPVVQDFNLTPTAPKGTLTGSVYDSVTLAPIDGAQITETLTAESARIKVDTYSLLLTVGDHLLQASANGYTTSDPVQVTITKGGTTTQDFSLVPVEVVPTDTGTLSGTVTDINTGALIGGAPISYTNVLTGMSNLASTDATGKYAIKLELGTYDVSASASGYATSDPVSINITEKGQLKTWNFTLSPAEAPKKGSLIFATIDNLFNNLINKFLNIYSVQAADKNAWEVMVKEKEVGNPIMGAKFYINGSLNPDLTTDANGSLILPTAPVGTYSVYVTATGYKDSDPVSVKIVDGGTATNIFLLEKSAQILTPTITIPTVSDIIKGGNVTISGTTENIADGEIIQITVTKKVTPITLSGQVTCFDAYDRPVDSAKVEIWSPDVATGDYIGATKTDSQGFYTITVNTGTTYQARVIGPTEAYQHQLSDQFSLLGDFTGADIVTYLKPFPLKAESVQQSVPLAITKESDGINTLYHFSFKIQTYNNDKIYGTTPIVPYELKAQILDPNGDGTTYLKSRSQLNVIAPVSSNVLEKLKNGLQVKFQELAENQTPKALAKDLASASTDLTQMGGMIFNIVDENGSTVFSNVTILNKRIGQISLPIYQAGQLLDYWPAGEYKIIVDAKGYATQSQSINVTAGENTAVNIGLTAYTFDQVAMEPFLKMQGFNEVSLGEAVIFEGATNINPYEYPLTLEATPQPPKISINQALTNQFQKFDDEFKLKFEAQGSQNIQKMKFKMQTEDGSMLDWVDYELNNGISTSVEKEIDVKEVLGLDNADKPDGKYIIYVAAEDTLGQSTDSDEYTQLTVYKDTRPPKPPQGFNKPFKIYRKEVDEKFYQEDAIDSLRIPIGEKVDLYSNLEDDTALTDNVSDMEKVVWYVDDVQICEDTTAPFTCEWDTTELHSTVTTEGYDGAGNVYSSSYTVETYSATGRRSLVADETAPEAVTQVEIINPDNNDGTSLLLTWTNPTDDDLKGVEIYRSTTLAQIPATPIIKVEGAESYTDVDLTADTIYYYTFRPYDITGNVSTDTNQYSGTPIVQTEEIGGDDTDVVLEEATGPTQLEFIPAKETGLAKISLELKSNSFDTSNLIASETQKPAEIESVAKDNEVVYKYFNITLNDLNDENIEEAVLEFSVAKSWLSENDINPESVKFYHYVYHSPGSWEKITTVKSSEDDAYYYYQGWTAEVDGLYGIVGRKNDAPAEETPLGRIGGMIFMDTNQDGKFNSEETGIKDITVKLYVDLDRDTNLNFSKDELLLTQTVNQDGVYSFDELPSAYYIIYIDRGSLPENYALTTNNEPLFVPLGEGEIMENFDIGYRIVPAENVEELALIQEQRQKENDETNNIIVTRKARRVISSILPAVEAKEEVEITRAIAWASAIIVVMVFLVWQLTKKPKEAI
ncbi:MAG: carboxypeptidase regulatory-like domain-containing protein [Patescibacteria group bacterium]|nr:carboxypeptidase regulatory-like domain-containing protein [Patescibacteria group bacterium]